MKPEDKAAFERKYGKAAHKSIFELSTYELRMDAWQAALEYARQPAEPVASIYITPCGEREFDDWKHDLPVGRNTLYTHPAPAVDLTHMVNRFLGWKLPMDFAPDCGISIDTEIAGRNGWPSGTNLLNAEQAKQMFEYVTQVTPAVAQEPVGEVKAKQGRTGTFVLWYKQPQPGDKLYTEALAVAVNTALLKAATKLADDLHALIGESAGVAGLHQNGELADWESLMRGGRFESWLMSLDELDEALIEAGNHTEVALDKVAAVAQPPAEVVRELKSALLNLLTAIQRCHCENSGQAQDRAIEALDKAKEHGL